MSVATSKSLRASTELLLIADIKPGLVQVPEPTPYAARLKQFFEVLFRLRKRSVELEGTGFGPLERLHTLHFVRFALFDQDTRLLLAVTFDKPWEPYIRSIVDDAGPILDVILSHCEGFGHNTSKDGFPGFARWVREKQIETHFLHAGFPEQSIDDTYYLRNLKRQLESQPPEGTVVAPAALALAARVQPEHREPPSPNDLNNFERVLVALYRLRSRFPDVSTDGPYTDQQIYDRAASLILNGSFDPDALSEALQRRARDHAEGRLLPDALVQAYNGIDRWLDALLEQPAKALQRASRPSPPPHEPLAPLVQGIVHPGYDEMTHGCLVLVRFPKEDELEDRRRLLEYLAEHATSGDRAGSSGVKLNVGFTAPGLRKLGFDPLVDRLPVEFRDGMEARAGLLGDVGTNHPEHWQRPRQNWPDEERPQHEGDEIDLSTVDAVVLLQTRSEGIAGDHAFVARHPLRPEVAALEGAGAVILHVHALRRYAAQADAGGKFREHFGYVDGIGQPEVTRPPAPPGEYNNAIAAGELLIGRLDDRGDEGDFGADEELRELLGDGTYMAIRDLAQDVPAFRAFVDQHAKATGNAPEVLYAKVMGRDLDGRPVTTAPGAGAHEPHAKPPQYANDFDYRKRVETDTEDLGQGCPLQSHIRLANPRLAVSHSVHGNPKRMPRIVRRGFSYGPLHDDEPGAPRGLLFMACNAKLGEQYEVIQRWINGANSTGLHSSQRDLLTAPHDPNESTRFTFEHAGRTHTLPAPGRPFVTLRWGLYVLLPSMACLQRLPGRAERALRRRTDSLPPGMSLATDPPPASRSRQPVTEAAQELARGKELLKALRLVELLEGLAVVEPGRAEVEWRKVLEDTARRSDWLALWRAIRAGGGVLRAPHAVLVGSYDLALEVLRDEQRFSVRGYWRRMRDSSMLMYLGMDERPLPRAVCPVHAGTGRPDDQEYVDAIGTRDVDYGRVRAANRAIYDISRVHAFVVAFDAAQRAIHQARQIALAGGLERANLDLPLLGDRAVSDVSERFFGLPNDTHIRKHGQPTTDDEAMAYCPSDFTIASQFIFRAKPDPWTGRLSAQRGAAVSAAAARYVADTADDPHPFVRSLREGLRAQLEQRPGGPTGAALERELEEEVVRSLVGSVDGFVAANWGSFMVTMRALTERDELARVQPDVKRLGELCKGANAGLSELAFAEVAEPDAWKATAMRAARGREGAAKLADGFDSDSQDPGERAPEVDRALWALGKLAYELGDDRPFAKRVIDVLKLVPVPAWLHRTALVKTELGRVEIEPGDAVVIHLGSAALEEQGSAMLFGGPYDPGKEIRPLSDAHEPKEPLHACPGRDLALGTLLGMLTAVMQEQDLRKENAYTVSCRVPDQIARAS